MGGVAGYGPVTPEPHEPVFHAPWEGRMLALQRAMSYTRQWTIDEGRAAQERLPRAVYLAASYYERWMLGMMDRLTRLGLADADELAAGHALRPGKKLPRRLDAGTVPNIMTRGNFGREPQAPPRFKPGDRVITRAEASNTHTRLPRYARGRVGVVEAVRGCHVYPDAVVAEQREDPQWLYTVVFTGRELWGENADPTLKVSIEAFEPYIAAAKSAP